MLKPSNFQLNKTSLRKSLIANKEGIKHVQYNQFHTIRLFENVLKFFKILQPQALKPIKNVCITVNLLLCNQLQGQYILTGKLHSIL